MIESSLKMVIDNLSGVGRTDFFSKTSGFGEFKIIKLINSFLILQALIR